jgi:DNA-directed RNA polymerase subunit M/transcription elongation factor TFIIS
MSKKGGFVKMVMGDSNIEKRCPTCNSVLFFTTIQERGQEDGNLYKTSLGNNMKEILVKSLADKRVGHVRHLCPTCKAPMRNHDQRSDLVNYDSESEFFRCPKCGYESTVYRNGHIVHASKQHQKVLPTAGGFDNVDYKELVEHIRIHMETALDRQIFMLLVDPPLELSDMAIMDNRKKMKVGLIRKKHIHGVDSVRPRSRFIIEYLSQKGCPITESEYYSCVKRIRKIVSKIVTPRGKSGKARTSS